ncbi:glycosylphosphatidylinositol anchor biosynthesis [Sporothrix eucalyptigena]
MDVEDNEQFSSQSAPRPRPLALEKLYQDGAPFNGRAVAWSPDAELAVSTYDSVYIYVPQFTSAAGGRMPIRSKHAIEQKPGLKDVFMQEQTDISSIGQFATGTETRNQFAAGVRRIPVGYPRPDHRINHHLFSVLDPDESGSDTSAWQEEPPRIYAGSGPISGSGSSMNSVVSLAWSPSGVGRNRRSVLGVLTTSGMLILYGEPLEKESKQDKSSDDGSKTTIHGRSSYDTSRWEILWAVGERLAVPGQKKTGECIVSFAWTGGCDALVHESLSRAHEVPKKAIQAFLVYQTDKRDIALLKVSHLRNGDGSERWHVVETNRFRAPGPHTLTPGAMKSSSSRAHDTGADPMFVPYFTPFGLRCSPWMLERVPSGTGEEPETVLTCLIGYLAPHYVGFRRLAVIRGSNGDGGQPRIHLDEQDCAGYCMFLTGNAMLEFEEGLWDEDTTSSSRETSTTRGSVSRCVVATPSGVKTCEVWFESPHLKKSSNLHSGPSEHVLGDKTCLADSESVPENHANPITGIVVHPPDPRNRGDGPLYSIVRQSASTRHGWYSGNALAGAETPEWVGQIQSRIAPNLTGNSEEDEQAHIADNDLATDGSQYRVRLWGLDQAPGGVQGSGGITAVLMTEHPVNGSRSGRNRERSYVLFGSQGQLAPRFGGAITKLPYHRPAVSTEATMWSYMYGNGPEVVSRNDPQDNDHQDLVSGQICSICDAPIAAKAEILICNNGHQFDRCPATGLAIQKPNVSQACGVCGRRELLPEALEEMLKLCGIPDAHYAELQAKLLDRECGFCGGKFYE